MTIEDSIAPKRVKYIKLGKDASWAKQAIDEGKILFGAQDTPAELCLAADWDTVVEAVKDHQTSKANFSNGIRQTKDFYSTEETLWITAYDKYLWWCISKGQAAGATGVVEEGKPAHFRYCTRPWSNRSINGNLLIKRNLSSSLTQTLSYQRTICNVKAEQYLLRLINDVPDPLQIEAENLQANQLEITSQLISRLHFTDFETLVDLIFSRHGWLRSSTLGRQVHDVDLIAEQKITGQTAWVQVKMTAKKSQLEQYLARFHEEGICTDFFFVCFQGITAPDFEEENLHLWTRDVLAKQVVDAGLFGWLVEQI